MSELGFQVGQRVRLVEMIIFSGVGGSILRRGAKGVVMRNERDHGYCTIRFENTTPDWLDWNVPLDYLAAVGEPA